jgi:hypothetical protein
LIILPQNGGDVSQFPPIGSAVMFILESSTVRVQGGNLGPGGACVDQAEGDPTFLGLRLQPGGAVAATFENGGLSSGHCAGPLSQDLARILIRGHRSRGRRPSFDFRGATPFTAGPFSGTLTSTLVLRPFPPSELGGALVGVSSNGSSSGPPLRKVLVEEVDLRYRVAAAPATLNFTFAGEPGPFCNALNSCGAHGSLSLAFPRLQTEVEIMASRIVKKRIGRAQALRDFRAGKLPIFGAPPVSWLGPRLSESFTNVGTCTDAVTAPQFTLVFGGFSTVAVPVVASGPTNPDPLRTHCPGPVGADVLGSANGIGTLAAASIPRRQLLERQWTFALDAGGGFSAPGYTGARSGRLTVSMSLLKVIAGTHKGQG